MTRYRNVFVLQIKFLALLLLSVACTSQAIAQGPTRVAAIGDSNTAGLGIAGADNTYPEHLQSLLGPAYDVNNYGVSGADVLLINNGPYINTTAHANAVAFNPNVVVSNLGINDFNLISANQADFVSNYGSILSAYQGGGNNPNFLIQTRLPEVVAPNSNAGTILGLQGIYNTRLDEVATNIGAVGLDVRSALDSTIPGSSIQGDGLHLTTAGALLVATETRDALLAQQGVAITANTENVNNRALSEGQSFTISDGSHLDSADLSQTVALSAFAMRNRTTSGTLFTDDVTLRIYEGYDQTVAGDGGAALGSATLIGSSTDTVKPSDEGIGGELVWSFADLMLDKDTQYSAVFTNGAGNVINFATELDTTNSYSGGRTLGFTGVNSAGWDSAFTAVYSTASIPEPGSLILFGSALAVCSLRRRRSIR